jgi:inner membrane transporter RhtA
MAIFLHGVRPSPAGRCAVMDRCQSITFRAAVAPAATPQGAVTSAGPVVGVTAARAVGAKVPPQTWFIISAVFHYLGPSFAVLLFPAVGVLGVAWFRIASAAVVFAPITRPWRLFARMDKQERRLLVGMGTCLALMNCCFYLALARLPMSLVAAIEFVGSIGLALYGMRTPRNRAALGIAIAGVFILIHVRWSTNLSGLGFAFANGALFVLYVVLGHRMARAGAGAGIERLGAAMAIAFIAVLPVGIVQAARAFSHPVLVFAGIGVGICSSVIPYVCDQLAMARLPRASFALMLTLLPASATIIGAIVLGQIPSPREMTGIALVMSAMALHRPAEAA